MRLRANHQRNQAAFSLIESIVVMLTIILLASIVIPGLLGRGNKAPKLPDPKQPVKREVSVKIDRIPDPDRVAAEEAARLEGPAEPEPAETTGPEE